MKFAVNIRLKYVCTPQCLNLMPPNPLVELPTVVMLPLAQLGLPTRYAGYITALNQTMAIQGVGVFIDMRITCIK